VDTSTAHAAQTVRCGASSSEAPKPAAPMSSTLRLARFSDAEVSAPARAPTPKLALSTPNTSGPELLALY
jgi:hypothetical protein